MNQTREQAKEVLCKIIAASGGVFNRKVALYKAFYYAHLFYRQAEQETLTEYPIVRMPNGPGIDEGNQLLEELEREGRICIQKTLEGPYKEYSYALTQPYTVDPNDPRYRAIEQAVEFVQGKSASELSAITHEYSRSWQKAANGEELNIYIDLLEDEEYTALQRRLKETEEMVNRVFAA